MTIEKQLTILNDVFHKLHKDFSLLQQEKAAIDQKYFQLQEQQKQEMQNELGIFLAQKEEVLKYCRIAEDNTSAVLQEYPGLPAKPDYGKLNNLVLAINQDLREEPNARQVIKLSGQYIAWLNKEMSAVQSRRQYKMQSLEHAKAGEIENIKQKRKAILGQCEAYLDRPEIKKLLRQFGQIKKAYIITNNYFSDFGENIPKGRTFLYGYRSFKLDVPKFLLPKMSLYFGHYFHEEEKTIDCPCGLDVGGKRLLEAEYVEANSRVIKKGIQALILNGLQQATPMLYRVSLLDKVFYNASLLGPLYVLEGEKNSIIEKVPSNEQQLNKEISRLEAYYRNVEKTIGMQTLYDYNKNPSNTRKIPYRLLILNVSGQDYGFGRQDSLNYLLNNAEKLGITVVFLTKSSQGSKNTKKEQFQNLPGHIRIISDHEGNFYMEGNQVWFPYQWITSPDYIPQDFTDKLRAMIMPQQKGTEYFKHFAQAVPKKTYGKRRPVRIPFGVDENDTPVFCSFEAENFAAFMMGAARSGKTYLLHTMITGLIMNYHPDEVELWLLDFKMTEFKQYANWKVPHIKYLLLESSRELVMDMIERMEQLLNDREQEFSRNNWKDIKDIPAEIYMPVVFIIIDEFGDMSRILDETGYVQKFDVLFQKGGAFGIKILLAHQSYSQAAKGLSAFARQQMQMRFALKNTPVEMKDTLDISSDQYTSQVKDWVDNMPVWETLFKCKDSNGRYYISKLRNLYVKDQELEQAVANIKQALQPVPYKTATDDNTYIEKNPVYVDGSMPQTLQSRVSYYQEYEKSRKMAFRSGEGFLYPGVPCSLELARPFLLRNGVAENILLFGTKRDDVASVLLAILQSYARIKGEIEIWADNYNAVYQEYKDKAFRKYRKETDIFHICERVKELKKQVKGGQACNRLILCLGYEKICTDIELLSDDDWDEEESVTESMEESFDDLQEKAEEAMDLLDQYISGDMDLTQKEVEQLQKMISDYNNQVENNNGQSVKEVAASAQIYDIRNDVVRLLKRAPVLGTHFLFCFEKVFSFKELKISEKIFGHKLAFQMPKDDTYDCGIKGAENLKNHFCLYTSGTDTYTFRPHIYRGIPTYENWTVNPEGKVVHTGEQCEK